MQALRQGACRGAGQRKFERSFKSADVSTGRRRGLPDSRHFLLGSETHACDNGGRIILYPLASQAVAGPLTLEHQGVGAATPATPTTTPAPQ